MTTIEFQHDVWQIQTFRKSSSLLIRVGYIIPCKEIKEKHQYVVGIEEKLDEYDPERFRDCETQARYRIQIYKKILRNFKDQRDMSNQLLRYLQNKENVSYDILTNYWGWQATFLYKRVPIPLLHPNFPNKGAIMLLLEAKGKLLAGQPERYVEWKETIDRIKYTMRLLKSY